jgi:hypothetical protein
LGDLTAEFDALFKLSVLINLTRLLRFPFRLRSPGHPRCPSRIKHRLRSAFQRQRNITEIIKSDCAGGSGCQIDMSSADERASIIYPHDHAAVVVDLNLRSKRQCTMRRRHRRAMVWRRTIA